MEAKLFKVVRQQYKTGLRLLQLEQYEAAEGVFNAVAETEQGEISRFAAAWAAYARFRLKAATADDVFSALTDNQVADTKFGQEIAELVELFQQESIQ